MLPDEVREALERFDGYMDAVLGEYPSGEDAWQTIRAHLLAREAEVAEVRREMDDYNAVESALEDATATGNKLRDRAERAEALLRECLAVMELHPATHARITAHLSENSR